MYTSQYYASGNGQSRQTNYSGGNYTNPYSNPYYRSQKSTRDPYQRSMYQANRSAKPSSHITPAHHSQWPKSQTTDYRQRQHNQMPYNQHHYAYTSAGKSQAYMQPHGPPYGGYKQLDRGLPPPPGVASRYYGLIILAFLLVICVAMALIIPLVILKDDNDAATAPTTYVSADREVTTIIPGSLTYMGTFIDALTDPTSPEYDAIAGPAVADCAETNQNVTGFDRCEVTSMVNGSIKIFFNIIITKTITVNISVPEAATVAQINALVGQAVKVKAKATVVAESVKAALESLVNNNPNITESTASTDEESLTVTAIDLCANINCNNRGTCSGGNCTCNAGFAGTLCETDLCTGNTCSGNGNCAVGVCTCNAGFAGTDCATDLCADCLNGACTTGECTCNPGFAGTNCETDQCTGVNCGANGNCTAGACTCDVGFTGSSCETDQCTGVNCGSNGNCIAGACTCDVGFTGSSCETDICTSCVNGNCTTGECICDYGFTGVNCETDMCTGRNCSDNGNCSMGMCVCNPGYSGMDCESTLAQICDNKTCSGNGICNNATGLCNCTDPAYIGKDCEIPCPCQNGGMCMDKSCQCPPTHTGRLCETAFEYCNDTNPCHNNGTCEPPRQGEDFTTCHCPIDFTGYLCEIMFEYCDNDTACNGGWCVPQNRTIPDPPSPPNNMTNPPPDNNMTNPNMTNMNGSCDCPPDRTGSRCETVISECDFGANSCLNGGTCLDENTNNSYCGCQPEFTGRKCEVEIINCTADSNCTNEGICDPLMVNETERRCNCAPGWTGYICDVPLYCTNDGECNGGNCSINLPPMNNMTNPNNMTDPPPNNMTYPTGECACPFGRSGQLCTVDTQSNDCSYCQLQGGMCMTGANLMQMCQCPMGRTGRFCDMNDCEGNPCYEGWCDGSQCVCFQGWMGADCSTVQHP